MSKQTDMKIVTYCDRCGGERFDEPSANYDGWAQWRVQFQDQGSQNNFFDTCKECTEEMRNALRAPRAVGTFAKRKLHWAMPGEKP